MVIKLILNSLNKKILLVIVLEFLNDVINEINDNNINVMLEIIIIFFNFFDLYIFL